jgi:hypothetical protein
MSLKKLIFIILFSSYLFFIPSFSPINAQGAEKDPDFDIFGTAFITLQEAAQEGNTTLEKWTQDQIISSMMSILRMFIGEIPENFFTELQNVTSTGKGKIPEFVVGGAIKKSTEMITTLFNPPASGIQYIANTWGNVLGKPAYAQGYGFNGIEFLLPLWKAARNIIYILSSIVFVIIGLMIILRIKISPQAVVTIQSAIPTVITTLILVTFSYAIAGLLIDISNIILGIVISILFNTIQPDLTNNLFDLSTTLKNIPNEMDSIIGQTQGMQEYINSEKIFNFKNLIDSSMLTLKSLSLTAAPQWYSFLMLGGMIGTAITGIFIGSFSNTVENVAMTNSVGSLVGIIGGLLLPIIFAIMIGVWLIKLWFGLVKIYITIIFKIISAPLEIGMGIFPNSKIGFSSWLLDIFANIMVFPIITIFLIVLNLIKISLFDTTIENVWAPGIIWSLPGGFVTTSILSSFISMAGLALISKLPEMIPQYIFMIKPSPFGAAIGENLKTPKYVTQAKDLAVGTGATWGYKKLTTAPSRGTAPVSSPAGQAFLGSIVKALGGNTN